MHGQDKREAEKPADRAQDGSLDMVSVQVHEVGGTVSPQRSPDFGRESQHVGLHGQRA
ncbi:hypothetical protein GCM10020216_092340 [Nonomuraea helvata]